MEFYPQPAHITHDEYCKIWQAVKSGKLESLQGWDRVSGKLMLEHPEYQYYWDLPHAVAMDEVEEIFEQGRADPDFHLAIEVCIVEQIETVPEVCKAFDAILRIGREEHEARHVIGRIFSDMLWEGSQMAKKGQQPDEDFYLRRIRRLIKDPKKVIKEQEEVSDMRVPSDEEWESAILESEKAFREVLAIPNKTIPEALVQGAELVNATGQKWFFYWLD